ncbi:hypothetical protein BKA70DRAFT_1393698 [Coprinopsis sp. MPI-PUGE-AT-0042]|nr:hypothetical protein BKA70DRAFT_1393698 [Coprinopsis sp. MPI-PUGE-AT-0042]
MSMFHSAVQSPIMSLFSSTGSEPLGLWSKRIDGASPDLSFIHLLHDESSKPGPAAGCSLVPSNPSESHGYLLDQTVLHIQSPYIRKAYIECPPAAPGITGRSAAEDLHPSRQLESNSIDLGIRHPYIHLQVRNLERDWSFEIGIKDQAGRNGIIRFSTFQAYPRLKKGYVKPPILHLPLRFPPMNRQALTSWATIDLHLPTYMSYFSSPGIQSQVSPDSEVHEQVRFAVPRGLYSHVTYVRVYATCRLRRIWFDEGKGQHLPWEFDLYSKQ